MVKLAAYCLMVVATVQAESSVWSAMDLAWEDLTDQLELEDESMKNLQYPQLPNSFKLPVKIQFKSVAGICDSIYNCADCNTVQLCQPTRNGTYIPTYNTTCPRNAPYCTQSSGTCSSMPDPECGTPDNFVCTSDGYFPDASNCSIYHACNNYQSTTFICGTRNYDPVTQTCLNNVPCLTADCTGKSGRKVPIGKTNYFSYCISGLSVLVDRCIGNYNLNSTSQQCEPVCTQNGLMTDYIDCTKYYKCTTLYISPGFTVMQREHLACQKGYVYNPTYIMCMSGQGMTCNQTKV